MYIYNKALKQTFRFSIVAFGDENSGTNALAIKKCPNALATKKNTQMDHRLVHFRAGICMCKYNEALKQMVFSLIDAKITDRVLVRKKKLVAKSPCARGLYSLELHSVYIYTHAHIFNVS